MPRSRPWIRAGAPVLATLLLSGTIWSAPADAAPGDSDGEAMPQCTIIDPRIDELSGLVGLPSGDLLVVEDSTPEPRPGSTSVLLYQLGADCRLVGEVSEFAQDPLDIEDLAFRDDTVWFADIGDNARDRDTVALITVSYDPSDPPTAGSEPTVYRLRYPDGPHDAEALLLGPDGTPYLVTKDPSGRSAVYRPSTDLDPSAEVSLDKVADLRFSMTGTPGGPVDSTSQLLVTGGAVSTDGSRIALRTYTDAYVWSLTGNAVAEALQDDPLAVVALPDTPQGEAISFTADSQSLLIGTEGVGSTIMIIPVVPASNPDSEADKTETSTNDTEPPGSSTSDEGSSPLFATSPVSVVVIAAVSILALGVVWFVRRRRRADRA